MASSNIDALTNPDKLTDTLDHARTNVATVLDRAADSVRELGGSGQQAEWAHMAANEIGSAAGYLRMTDVRRMGEQARDAIQARPGTALLVAASAGFLIGAMLRRR